MEGSSLKENTPGNQQQWCIETSIFEIYRFNYAGRKTALVPLENYGNNRYLKTGK